MKTSIHLGRHPADAANNPRALQVTSRCPFGAALPFFRSRNQSSVSWANSFGALHVYSQTRSASVLEARNAWSFRSASSMKAWIRHGPETAHPGRGFPEERAVPPDLGAGEQDAPRIDRAEHLLDVDRLCGPGQDEPAGDAFRALHQLGLLQPREDLGEKALGDSLVAREVADARGRRLRREDQQGVERVFGPGTIHGSTQTSTS